MNTLSRRRPHSKGKGLFPIPSALLLPPSTEVNYPTTPRVQHLPFNELGWENFQRLCLALGRECYPEYQWKTYGNQGQRQDGIDLIGLPPDNAKHVVIQCKCVSMFTASKLKLVFDTFFSGELADQAAEFILAVSIAATQPAILQEIARQKARFRSRGIALRIWDAEELSLSLKPQSAIVTDFFGTAWRRAFCPKRGGDDEPPPAVHQAVENVLSVFRKTPGALHKRVQQAINILKGMRVARSETRRFLSPVYLLYSLEMDYLTKASNCNRVTTTLVNLSAEPIATDWEDLWGTVPLQNAELDLVVRPTKSRRVRARISESESTMQFKRIWFDFDPPLKAGELQKLNYKFSWKGQTHIPGVRWHEFRVDSPMVSLTLTVKATSVRFGNVIEYEYQGIIHRLLLPQEYRLFRNGSKHSLTIKNPAFKRRYRIEFTPA